MSILISNNSTLTQIKVLSNRSCRYLLATSPPAPLAPTLYEMSVFSFIVSIICGGKIGICLSQGNQNYQDFRIVYLLDYNKLFFN